MQRIPIGEFKRLKVSEIVAIIPCELTSEGDSFALILPNCTVGMTQKLLAMADMGKVPRKEVNDG